MFKRMSEMMSMMRNLQGMGGQLRDMSEELRQQRVLGQAGGGMVEAEMNGAGELLRVRIAPELADRGDREMLEDLVTAAVSQAIAKAQECSADMVQSLASDLPMGDLSGLLQQINDSDNVDEESSDSMNED